MFKKLKKWWENTFNNLDVNKCKFSLSRGNKHVVIETKCKVILVNRKNNEKKTMISMTLGIKDVGSQWTEFEVYDIKNPIWRKYIGWNHTNDTSIVYLNLQAKLKKPRISLGVKQTSYQGGQLNGNLVYLKRIGVKQTSYQGGQLND